MTEPLGLQRLLKIGNLTSGIGSLAVLFCSLDLVQAAPVYLLQSWSSLEPACWPWWLPPLDTQPSVSPFQSNGSHWYCLYITPWSSFSSSFFQTPPSALCSYPFVRWKLEIRSRFSPQPPFSCSPIISDRNIWATQKQVLLPNPLSPTPRLISIHPVSV